MQDGLYISGKYICEVDFSLTFQGNDLTQPDARTASYSNTFTLPDSLVVRDLLEGGEQLDAGGPNPYRQLPAKVVDNGEVTFSGVIEFVSFSNGWKVNLLESVISFFDFVKDKPLTSLDLSRLDHVWSLDQITAYAGADHDVVYPLVDSGGIDNGIVPYDTMCPAIYAKTIFGQICQEAGYKPVGAWLNDPLFQKMALPFVGANPKAHDEEWIADRTARVTASGTPVEIVLENGRPINVLLPLSADNLPLDDFSQGKLRPFNTATYSYVCPSRMRLKVFVQVMFTSIVAFGAADIRLILEKNGQQVAECYYSQGGYHNGLDISETLQIDESIDCLEGDELQLRLTGSSRTQIAEYVYYFSLLPGDTWASFTPDSLVHLGDLWPVAQNLPADISCADLVLTIAKIMQGTYTVDDVRKTVELIRLDDVINNIPNARDWSRNTDESIEPEVAVQFENYGQNNLCKWKEADDKANLGYGDGSIQSASINKPKEATLFELPFMACIDSTNVIGGYGNPILIKTRQVSGYGDKQTTTPVDAAPRIILIEPNRTVTVQTQIATPSLDLVKVPVTLTACWWAKRPAGALMEANNFSLAFSPVFGQTEQPLVDRYFKGLKRVLRRPRMLTVSVYLDPMDIATLDLSVPILLQKVRIGGLDINYNLFYLNNLGPYRSGMVCNAVLIAV